MPARLLNMRRPEPTPDRTVVLYARVSSKEQEQGFSIPAQLRLLHDYAQQKGYIVLKEFTDVETAKKSGRTAFTEMLAFLRKHQCTTVLSEKTDRLYRNIKDWVTVDELGLELHFVKENVILTPDSTSSAKLTHGFKVLMAKNYIDNLSEETRKGMLEKARNGFWPSYAPVGYKNTTRSDGKRIITPDPATAPVITQLYEWFATGTYSLKTLAAKARKEGLRLGQGNLHKSIVHQILRKRLYSGDFDWEGITYHGTHEPLVTKEVWERVRELIETKKPKREFNEDGTPKYTTPDFTYSGIITCGHCGCSMTAEIKKGKYIYYHCTNGKRTNCPEPYTREEQLTTNLTNVLRELVVPKAITDWLRAALKESDVTQTRAREQALQHAQAEYDRLNQRIETMYLDKLDGRITNDFYDEKAAAWRQTQVELQRRIHELRTTTQNYEDAINSIETTSTLCKAFPTQSASEQRRLLKILIEKASWKAGELETTLRNPFQKLRLSNHATNTKQGKNGPGGTEMKNWLRR
jgi:site-specific DNA recombinase